MSLVNVLAKEVYVLIGKEIWKEDENDTCWRKEKESYGYVVGAEKDMETLSKGKQTLFVLVILDESHLLDIFVFFVFYIA